MEFKDELKKFVERIESLKDTIFTEEATKMSLIVPFFQLLGYDVFNPVEFCPEFTADVGIKKGEKVDYAILLDQKPIILIEAKSVNKKLDKHSSQLFRYFVTTSAKFAILTNGIIYKFYTDLDEANKMDKDPFLEVNLLALKENQIMQLEKFKRDNMNVHDILNSASLLKYNTLFRNYIEQQYENPSDEFVKLFLQQVYKGTKTQSVIEKFRPILKKALNDHLNELLNEKLQFALANSTSNKDSTAPTSTEEWNAFTIIKNILKNTIDINKISSKYTESYTAILYENNSRKWICRLILTSTQKLLILPDENKKEIRYPLSGIDDIQNFSESIINVATRYIQSTASPKKALLYTKWGVYEMPSPYKINFTRGPRTDLKPVNFT